MESFIKRMQLVNFPDSFAGTDPRGFNNSVAEQQVCGELLLMIYLFASSIFGFLEVKQP